MKLKPKRRRQNIIEIGPGSLVEMSDRKYICDKRGALRLLAKQQEQEKPHEPAHK